MDQRIYICTHKPFTPPSDSLYIPLQVGKAISDDYGYIGDDTGDNISELNRNWCELTGYYWLWKNISCDIIGVCHYRRFLSCNDTLLNGQDLNEILKTYDIILPTDRPTLFSSLKEQYTDLHNIKDLDGIRDIIRDIFPDYLTAFHLCINCNLFSLGNLIITGKNIFDEYCQWLFTILFEYSKTVRINEYDTYQGRLFGFLSERLLRVWVLHHSYKIYQLPVLEIES